MTIVISLASTVDLFAEDIAGNSFYLVNGDALVCVVENEDAYRMQGALIIVDTTKCHKGKEATDLSGVIVNELIDTEKLGGGVATILALTQSNLDCLPEITKNIKNEIVKYFPDECRIEAK